MIVDAGYHASAGDLPAAGDVELSPALLARAGAYTPVPGGVGPMTIATLIAQTVESAERAAALTPALTAHL